MTPVVFKEAADSSNQVLLLTELTKSSPEHRLYEWGVSMFFSPLKVGWVRPKRGCLLTLAYYAFPRWYEFGERRCNDIDRGKTCPSATLSTTNPTWIEPGSNLGLRGDRPATNAMARPGRVLHCEALESENCKIRTDPSSRRLKLRKDQEEQYKHDPSCLQGGSWFLEPGVIVNRTYEIFARTQIVRVGCIYVT
jgi:hypothetical protein